jgi:hypothetical protein
MNILALITKPSLMCQNVSYFYFSYHIYIYIYIYIYMYVCMYDKRIFDKVVTLLYTESNGL